MNHPLTDIAAYGYTFEQCREIQMILKKARLCTKYLKENRLDEKRYFYILKDDILESADGYMLITDYRQLDWFVSCSQSFTTLTVLRKTGLTSIHLHSCIPCQRLLQERHTMEHTFTRKEEQAIEKVFGEKKKHIPPYILTHLAIAKAKGVFEEALASYEKTRGQK